MGTRTDEEVMALIKEGHFFFCNRNDEVERRLMCGSCGRKMKSSQMMAFMISVN